MKSRHVIPKIKPEQVPSQIHKVYVVSLLFRIGSAFCPVGDNILSHPVHPKMTGSYTCGADRFYPSVS